MVLGVDIKQMVQDAAVNWLKDKATGVAEEKLGQMNQWVSDHTGHNPNLNVQNVTNVATGAESPSSLWETGENTAVNVVNNKIAAKLDPKALKRVSDFAQQTGIGKEALEKAGAESLEGLVKNTGEKIAEKGAKHLSGVVGEKAGKALAEKGAEFFLKKAARCIPGVGLITGGAIEAYGYYKKCDEMKEQYAGPVSEWLASQGKDVKPEDIKMDHLREYAKQNPILEQELDSMRNNALARTGAGAFGIFGMAAELGYDAVDMVAGSRSAHQIMVDMAEQQRSGQPIDKKDILEMVDQAYGGEKGKTYKDASPEQKAAMEAAAQHYADQLNSGELKAYDMVSVVGDGKLHEMANAQQQIGQTQQQFSQNQDDTGIPGSQASRYQSSDTLSMKDLEMLEAMVTQMEQKAGRRSNTTAPDDMTVSYSFRPSDVSVEKGAGDRSNVRS